MGENAEENGSAVGPSMAMPSATSELVAMPLLQQTGDVFVGPGAEKEAQLLGLGLTKLRSRQKEDLAAAKRYALDVSIKQIMMRQQQSHQQNQQKQAMYSQALSLMARVYIGSISFEIREDAIKKAFENFGPVKAINMSFDNSTGNHKGFAFLEFEVPEAAVLAQEAMNGLMMGGRNLKVVGRPANMPQAQPIIDMIMTEARNYYRVYVASVHPDLSESDLKSVFEAFGEVQKCQLARQSATGKGSHRGFGYIEFNNAAAAQEAIAGMNMFDLGGQFLRVGKCITPPEALNYLIPQTSSALPSAAAMAAAAVTAKIQASEVAQKKPGSSPGVSSPTHSPSSAPMHQAIGIDAVNGLYVTRPSAPPPPVNICHPMQPAIAPPSLLSSPTPPPPPPPGISSPGQYGGMLPPPSLMGAPPSLMGAPPPAPIPLMSLNPPPPPPPPSYGGHQPVIIPLEPVDIKMEVDMDAKPSLPLPSEQPSSSRRGGFGGFATEAPPPGVFVPPGTSAPPPPPPPQQQDKKKKVKRSEMSVLDRIKVPSLAEVSAPATFGQLEDKFRYRDEAEEAQQLALEAGQDPLAIMGGKSGDIHSLALALIDGNNALVAAQKRRDAAAMGVEEEVMKKKKRVRPPKAKGPQLKTGAQLEAAAKAGEMNDALINAQASSEDASLASQEGIAIRGNDARHLLMTKLMRTNRSCVLLLKNMVTPEDIDEFLEEEIKEECGKYGSVDEVVIVSDPTTASAKVFVRFSDPMQADSARLALDKRFFAGRSIQAAIYDQVLFEHGDYGG